MREATRSRRAYTWQSLCKQSFSIPPYHPHLQSFLSGSPPFHPARYPSRHPALLAPLVSRCVECRHTQSKPMNHN
ncbi:hypothetical protein E2C01_083579 [Portunus trituberculatus]|uniref:Uncharacterized protein n=1 Tax=Portunus trituberculatus TaxID=210409 RepID=A0A5B7J2H5_PORTR|nr:hypothetical protein [Portunus trituberculatus]